MSSAHDSWRKFLQFLDKNPEVETGLELTINVLSSIGPLLIAALVVLTKSGSPSLTSFGEAFGSFFEKGELSLLILAMSGSIIWLVTIKTVVANIFFRALFAIFSIFILTYVGVAIISGNQGFSGVQHGWVISLLWWLYVVSLIVWAIVSIMSKRTKGSEPTNMSSSGVTTSAEVAVLDTAIRAARSRKATKNVD